MDFEPPRIELTSGFGAIYADAGLAPSGRLVARLRADGATLALDAALSPNGLRTTAEVGFYGRTEDLLVTGLLVADSLPLTRGTDLARPPALMVGFDAKWSDPIPAASLTLLAGLDGGGRAVAEVRAAFSGTKPRDARLPGLTLGVAARARSTALQPDFLVVELLVGWAGDPARRHRASDPGP